MRSLIAAFFALLITVLATLWVKQDNGYVLVAYGQWTLEGSLALFSISILVLFLLLYVAVRVLSRLWHMPERVAEWRRNRRCRRAQHALTRGLVEMAEGRWKVAERHLIRYADQSKTPLLNYLAAARAAQLQGEHARRDEHLHRAHESMPSANVAVGLTQAELQLAHQQYEQALASLMHVRSLSPKHTYVLKLLKRLYENLAEWKKLEEMLPDLRRRNVLSDKEYDELEGRVFRERLKQESGSVNTLMQYWQKLPKEMRQEPAIFIDYVRMMMTLDAGPRIESLIVTYLQKTWSSDLVELYGLIELKDASHQLAVGEGWLKFHPEDPVLLRCLAKLSLQNKLWGKARSYFEASIAISPTPESYQQLGLLLEHMGEKEKAMQCFRSGLGLASKEPERALPLIGSRPALSKPESMSRPPDLLEGI